MNIHKHFLDYIIIHRVELTKFLIVGFSCLGLNLGIFHVFYNFFQLDYRISVTISYIITVTIYFSLHRLFTFRARDQHIAHHTWRFITMLLINYLITLSAVWITVHLFDLTPYVGILCATGVTAGVSFLLMRHFVFKKNKS